MPSNQLFQLALIESDLDAAKASLTEHVAQVRDLRQQLRDAEALVAITQRAVCRIAKRRSRFTKTTGTLQS